VVQRAVLGVLWREVFDAKRFAVLLDFVDQLGGEIVKD